MGVRFGVVEIDDAKRELRCHGQVANVAPKVFDLLSYLIQYRTGLTPDAGGTPALPGSAVRSRDLMFTTGGVSGESTVMVVERGIVRLRTTRAEAHGHEECQRLRGMSVHREEISLS